MGIDGKTEHGIERSTGMKILNLTQHAATPEQIAAGVVEPADREEVLQLLTFEELPAKHWIRVRAFDLAEIAKASGCQVAMIGGAPYLMAPLQAELTNHGIHSVYAFSKRESVEEVQKDGSVRKTQVFRHVGFVRAVEI